MRPALAVLFRIAVGPSADRYVRRFLAFERTGHGRPGWHWPSFLFPGVWAFYRKLWVIGLLFALLPIAGALGFAAIEPTFERADFIWIACAIVAVWILPGVLPALLADSLLYNHCRYLVWRAESGTQGAADAVHELRRRAPTSIGAALLLGGGALVGMLGVVVPPMHSAYVEAGVRAQVKQVLGAVRGLEEDIEVDLVFRAPVAAANRPRHAALARGCRADRGGARPSAHRARSPGPRAGRPGARRQDAPDRTDPRLCPIAGTGCACRSTYRSATCRKSASAR